MNSKEYNIDDKDFQQIINMYFKYKEKQQEKTEKNIAEICLYKCNACNKISSITNFYNHIGTKKHIQSIGKFQGEPFTKIKKTFDGKDIELKWTPYIFRRNIIKESNESDRDEKLKKYEEYYQNKNMKRLKLNSNIIFKCKACQKDLNLENIKGHVNSKKHNQNIENMNENDIFTKIQIDKDGKETSSNWIPPMTESIKRICEICDKEVYYIKSHNKSKNHLYNLLLKEKEKNINI